MSSGVFWATVITVALLYGVPQSIRTFRHEMRDDRKVILLIICVCIAAIIYIIRSI